jgi:hypothetical protein
MFQEQALAAESRWEALRGFVEEGADGYPDAYREGSQAAHDYILAKMAELEKDKP